MSHRVACKTENTACVVSHFLVALSYGFIDYKPVLLYDTDPWPCVV